MDEKALEAEARLAAVEYMVMNLYVLLHRLHGDPPELVRKTHEQLREMLRTTTFPGSDPAESDLIAQEVQAAVERLTDGITAMLGMGKR